MKSKRKDTENAGAARATFELAETHWPQDYELIDSGDRLKLERFGRWTLVRPEPQALWPPALPPEEWARLADVEFEPQGSHSGRWRRRGDAPDSWSVNYRSAALDLRFRLALTAFKHVGVFPEQAANWEFVAEESRRLGGGRVLNLFAYTGGATLAAAQAGAEVTHVDAVRQIVTWAKDNAERNEISGVRWLIDDALKFARRELRRGSRYSGIILDPPAYGHGPAGERWVLEQHLPELVALLPGLLEPKGHFLVLNSYSLGYSPIILAGLLQTFFPRAEGLSCGELLLPERAGGRLLPAGVFARLTQ